MISSWNLFLCYERSSTIFMRGRQSAYQARKLIAIPPFLQSLPLPLVPVHWCVYLVLSILNINLFFVITPKFATHLLSIVCCANQIFANKASTLRDAPFTFCYQNGHLFNGSIFHKKLQRLPPLIYLFRSCIKSSGSFCYEWPLSVDRPKTHPISVTKTPFVQLDFARWKNSSTGHAKFHLHPTKAALETFMLKS